MDKVVRFRMDAREKEALEAEAKKLGLSVSVFIRLLIKQWTDGIKFEREKVKIIEPTPADTG